MKLLIVGGLGYIGGRLANFLREKRCGLDICLTTTRKQYPLWVKNFRILQMDVLNSESIEQCLNNFKADVIIHLGAIPQFECQKNPQRGMDVNAQGTFELLKISDTYNIKQFIYLSTFQVYGDLSGNVFEGTPANPQNPYAVSKLKAEEFIKNFVPSNDMKRITLRLSNAYGFPMDKDVNVWHLVFNSFCKQCVVNNKIKILSNQYRNFIALRDVARAVEHFVFEIPNKWSNEVFNLGGNTCLSVFEVAQKITNTYQKYYGGDPIMIQCPSDIQTQLFQYNIEKLKNTGFEIQGNVETEIIETIKLCQKT